MNYREVAASLGLSPAGVGVAISEGRIQSTLVNGRRDVTVEEVERYRRDQLGRKRSLRGEDPMPRFMSRVIERDGCWEWTGGRNAAGYGRFTDVEQRRMALAHRWHWERVNGRIADGMQLDHLCRNRACVRLDHLEVVTPGENVRRGDAGEKIAEMSRAKTHCPQGHSYEGDNLIRRRGRRICRRCQRAAAARYRHRRHSSMTVAAA